MILVETPTRLALVDDMGKARIETPERFAVLRSLKMRHDGTMPLSLSDEDLDQLYTSFAAMR